jgi:hypothetical protein
MDALLKDIGIESSELKKFKRYLATQPEFLFEITKEQIEFEMDTTRHYLSTIADRVIDITKGMTDIDLNDSVITILKDKANKYFTTDRSIAAKVGNALEIAFNNTKNWWKGNISTDSNKQEDPFFEVSTNTYHLLLLEY